jgi:hypothetical protein
MGRERRIAESFKKGLYGNSGAHSSHYRRHFDCFVGLDPRRRERGHYRSVWRRKPGGIWTARNGFDAGESHLGVGRHLHGYLHHPFGLGFKERQWIGPRKRTEAVSSSQNSGACSCTIAHESISEISAYRDEAFFQYPNDFYQAEVAKLADAPA